MLDARNRDVSSVVFSIRILALRRERGRVPDGEVNVSWDDPLFLVISGRIARQFKDLCCQILEHRSYINLCILGHKMMEKQTKIW